MKRIRDRFGAGLTACGALMLACAGTASAGEARQVVHEGPLLMMINDLSLPSSTLTGSTQTISGSGSEWVAQDARGKGSGWSVTIAAGGPLTSAGGQVETTARTIAIGNLAFAPGTVTARPGSDPTTNLTATAITMSTSAQTFLACSSVCKGRYAFTPALTLTVPANAYRSNYSNAVNSSPLNPYTATLVVTIS